MMRKPLPILTITNILEVPLPCDIRVAAYVSLLFEE